MENSLNMDYVKIDSVFVDDMGGHHRVPRILELDNAIENIQVSDLGNKYSTFTIYRHQYEEEVIVETNKLDETFNAIYNTLHTLFWDVEDDEETNVD
jgi:hypothetical protein